MYVFVFRGHKNKNSTEVLLFDGIVYEIDSSLREKKCILATVARSRLAPAPDMTPSLYIPVIGMLSGNRQLSYTGEKIESNTSSQRKEVFGQQE